MTGLDVTFLSRPEDGEWQARASTLPRWVRGWNLRATSAANRYATTGSDGNAEFGDDMITRVINLRAASRRRRGGDARRDRCRRPSSRCATVEQRQALVLLDRRRRRGGPSRSARARGWPSRCARSTAAARRVSAGDYRPIDVSRAQDELGELAAAFRAMQAGVAANVSRMTELAHRDQLTGLPTRVLFVDRLEQAIACRLARRHAGRRC